jgi:proteic killer suppression protein
MLDRLDASNKLEDMNIPGYKFHSLTGDRTGDYSVTVTGNWRITFRFDGKNAVDVNFKDYH